MSGHLVITDESRFREILQAAHDLLRDSFGIQKTTIQIEHPELRETPPHA